LLLYVSYLAEASGQPDVAAIVRESWKNSERDDVSGLLVFDGSRFAQFLEGPEAAMQHLRSRLEGDHRHRDIEGSWCGQRAWIADGSRRGVWVI